MGVHDLQILSFENVIEFSHEKQMFGFLVIALTGSLGFGPDLVGIFPRSLPQLSKQLRDQNNSQKLRKKKKIEI